MTATDETTVDGSAADETATDSTTDTDRAELARRQTELLAALVAGGPAPDGFDAARLKVQARSLAAKRRDGVARALPVLPTALAERWPRVFMEWAMTHPKPEVGGSHADSLAFADHLRTTGELPDAVEAVLRGDAEADDSTRQLARKKGLVARMRARFTRTSAARNAWDPEAAYCSD